MTKPGTKATTIKKLAAALTARPAPDVQRVTLPVSPSANVRLRIGASDDGKLRFYSTKQYRRYKLDCDVLTRLLIPHPKRTRVEVQIAWHQRDGDQGDLDNRIKAVLDVLKGRGYADDKQVKRVVADIVEPHETAQGGTIQVTILKKLP